MFENNYKVIQKYSKITIFCITCMWVCLRYLQCAAKNATYLEESRLQSQLYALLVISCVICKNKSFFSDDLAWKSINRSGYNWTIARLNKKGHTPQFYTQLDYKSHFGDVWAALGSNKGNNWELSVYVEASISNYPVNLQTNQLVCKLTKPQLVRLTNWIVCISTGILTC